MYHAVKKDHATLSLFVMSVLMVRLPPVFKVIKGYLNL